MTRRDPLVREPLERCETRRLDARQRAAARLAQQIPCSADGRLVGGALRIAAVVHRLPNMAVARRAPPVTLTLSHRH